jgi:glycosyltransferase involved in cell wall biosynthesis
MKKTNPYFSIVICTYNGELSIENAIKSLLSQDFPSDKYEIIVVDDGSIDKTFDIIKRYPVKLVKHVNNLKLSAARNTGLKVARGEVYVCFDDDCVADVNWLKNLYEVYKTKQNIAGVGGRIVAGKISSLFDQYLNASGYGNPEPSRNYSYNIISRLFNYLSNTLIEQKNTGKIYLTNELAGGNSSFPMDLLKSVGGWDPDFSGIEDTELCIKIKNKLPGKKLYVTKDSKLVHNHKLSLFQFLQVYFNRSMVRYKYYKKIDTVPPIFPFPIILFLSLLIALLFSPMVFLMVILIGPILMYFSWTVKSIKYKKIVYILFPYIQLLYETAILMGMLKGALTK